MSSTIPEFCYPFDPARFAGSSLRDGRPVSSRWVAEARSELLAVAVELDTLRRAIGSVAARTEAAHGLGEFEPVARRLVAEVGGIWPDQSTPPAPPAINITASTDLPARVADGIVLAELALQRETLCAAIEQLRHTVGATAARYTDEHHWDRELIAEAVRAAGCYWHYTGPHTYTAHVQVTFALTIEHDNPQPLDNAAAGAITHAIHLDDDAIRDALTTQQGWRALDVVNTDWLVTTATRITDND